MSPAARQSSSRTPPVVDDFDANELVKEHGRSIQTLQADIDRLVERYGDDDKFGRTFEALAQKDKRVDGAIGLILIQLLGTNSDVRKAVAAAVNESDRKWFIGFGKRIGFALWSIALIVITAVIAHYWK